VTVCQVVAQNIEQDQGDTSIRHRPLWEVPHQCFGLVGIRMDMLQIVDDYILFISHSPRTPQEPSCPDVKKKENPESALPLFIIRIRWAVVHPATVYTDLLRQPDSHAHERPVDMRFR
jgi:hypothetical protein